MNDATPTPFCRFRRYIHMTLPRVQRVLIVEDETTFAGILQEYLVDHSFQVEVAGNVKDALALVESFRPDAIVTDLRMPGGSGLVLMRALRALNKNIRTFVMSAYPELESSRKEIEDLATGVFRKPFKLEKLAEAVHSSFDRRQEHDDHRRIIPS